MNRWYRYWAFAISGAVAGSFGSVVFGIVALVLFLLLLIAGGEVDA